MQMKSKTAVLAIEKSLHQNAQLWTTWFREFQKSLDLPPQTIEEIEVSMDTLQSEKLLFSPVPHVFFFQKNEQKKAELQNLFGKLRTLDPSVGIVVLTEGPATGRDTMNWLDMGASALISFDTASRHLNEALRELFASRILNHTVRTPRIPAKHKIVLQMASLEQAIVAETLNLGMGGMFIRTLPQDSNIGDLVEFEFVFSQQIAGTSDQSTWESNPALQKMEAETGTTSKQGGSLSQFSGKGSIVWIRSTAQASEPEGIGIQFLELESKTREFLLQFIKSHGFKSFIPRA
jgi:hypothetical protein